ncbi:hypothetical protein Lal_00043669 [Lupinus albus]|nr:hypothetical protein Lal_00043669 [Lupinus albus]
MSSQNEVNEEGTMVSTQTPITPQTPKMSEQNRKRASNPIYPYRASMGECSEEQTRTNTIYSLNDSKQWKSGWNLVSVDIPIEDDALLPIPAEDITTVREVVGTFVTWLEHLIDVVPIMRKVSDDDHSATSPPRIDEHASKRPNINEVKDVHGRDWIGASVISVYIRALNIYRGLNTKRQRPLKWTHVKSHQTICNIAAASETENLKIIQSFTHSTSKIIHTFNIENHSRIEPQYHSTQNLSRIQHQNFFLSFNPESSLVLHRIERINGLDVVEQCFPKQKNITIKLTNKQKNITIKLTNKQGWGLKLSHSHSHTSSPTPPSLTFSSSPQLTLAPKREEKTSIFSTKTYMQATKSLPQGMVHYRFSSKEVVNHFKGWGLKLSHSHSHTSSPTPPSLTFSSSAQLTLAPKREEKTSIFSTKTHMQATKSLPQGMVLYRFSSKEVVNHFKIKCLDQDNDFSEIFLKRIRASYVKF